MGLILEPWVDRRSQDDPRNQKLHRKMEIVLVNSIVKAPLSCVICLCLGATILLTFCMPGLLLSHLTLERESRAIQGFSGYQNKLAGVAKFESFDFICTKNTLCIEFIHAVFSMSLTSQVWSHIYRAEWLWNSFWDRLPEDISVHDVAKQALRFAVKALASVMTCV